MKKIRLSGSAVAAVVLSFAVHAADNIHTNTYLGGSFSEPTSFNDGYIPKPGDYVRLLEDTTMAATYGTADWDFVAGLGRIIPGGLTNCCVELTVPEGETAALGVPISAYFFYTDRPRKRGCIVKKGLGELQLTACRKVVQAADYSYYTKFHVVAGKLKMPSDEPATNYQLGRIEIDEGGVFALARGNGSTIGATYYDGVFGRGAVTNEYGTAAITFQAYLDEGAVADFYGRIDGYINLTCTGSGTQNFHGNESTAWGSPSVEAGALGFSTFGLNSQPSAMGCGGSYQWFGSSGGAFRFIGTSDVCDKQFVLARTSNLDGGPYGGLRLTGKIVRSQGGTNANYCVNLLGTNPSPCYVAGAIPADCKGNGGSVRTVGFRKTGSGKWRLCEHASRLNAGVIEVRGGALQFDSVEEAGAISSLGLSTNLLSLASGHTEDPVDYAILVGAADGESEAQLEFTGTNSQACTTRKIAVDGAGGLRNDNPATTIRWSGISALSAGSTLVLDGASTRSNEVAEVADGTEGRTLGVTKKGSGTWVLGGDMTFTGPLRVEGGKLIVRKPMPGKYTWFKWVWKSRGASGGFPINVEEMGLYDKDDKRINKGLTEVRGYSDLAPGQVSWGSQVQWQHTWSGNDYPARTLKKMFDGSNGYGFHAIPLQPTGGAWVPLLGDPSEFIPIVMRLAEGKNEVASWDYMNVWLKGNSSSIAQSALYGSVDGLHWELVDSNTKDDFANATVTWSWAFNGVQHTYGDHTGGRPIVGASTREYLTLTGSPRVSVAPGATLEVEGETTVVLSKLEVGGDGMGTVKGFSLAAEGDTELNVACDLSSRPKHVSISVDFTQFDDWENVRTWTVKLNGEEPTRYDVRVRADGITLDRKGLLLLVR